MIDSFKQSAGVPVINLAYSDETLFKINRYPDGQQSFKLIRPLNSKKAIIKSRFNSFRDLELIIGANQALRESGVKKVHLYVPYFLGARSDRKFNEGESNYLKTVVCPIINQQKFKSVTVLDPHSDVLEALLDNFKKINNFELFSSALRTIERPDREVVLVSPDGGALKKIYDLAEHFEIDHVITAQKHRDVRTGKITHTEVPGIDMHEQRDYVIVDDICDGGRTFVEIAKVFSVQRPTARLYLVVTHGIFSDEFDELKKYFTQIFCTNSVKYVSHPIVTQINVL